MTTPVLTYEWPEPMPITELERNILNPPPKPPMLEWARENFCLPAKTSKISGQWNDEYTPFIRRPMQLLERPPVSVWISACTQGVKTTLVQLLLAYICAIDPGPTGIVMPQEGDAKKRIRTKIRPLFAANPVLYEKIGRDVRNLNIGEETDLGDMLLYLIWATSAAKLADSTIQNMIYDEVGKFDIITTTDEDPIELGRNRQRTYSAIMRELGVSSPQNAGDLFDSQVRSGSDEQWYVPCMLCGRWHKLQTYVDPKGEQYIVLDTEGGQYYHHSRYKSGKHSRYVCPQCKQGWSEADRWRSNKEGLWVPKGQEMDPNGKIIGEPGEADKFSFNVHAMMLWPEFAKVGSLAAQYVEADEDLRKGKKKKLKNWQLNQRNLPWKEEVRVISGHALDEKKNDLPAGVVPVTAKLLTAGADFHKDAMGNIRVDYIVKAWSDDLRSDDILFGHAASLEEMFRVTTSQSFPWAQDCGRPELMLACGFVDSGYQPDQRARGVIDEVYKFCKNYWRLRIWYPIRGRSDLVERFYSRPLDKVVEAAEKRHYRGRMASQYRGMELIDLAVDQFKDLVADWAEAPFDAPASTRYNREMPPEFFKELTNEYKGRNDKGQWGWWVKDDGLGTHGLDVSVYATAAGYFKNVDSFVSEAELQRIEQAMAERTQPVRRAPVRRRPTGGGWLDGYRKL
ncbi:MAG: phage terminase large subunit family protein [Planctomycetaceae bacterium]|nr:phage terminase large subunit family protein [Planctomycetaceae bacterium]